MSKRTKSFFKIVLLLAVLAASAYLYTPVITYADQARAGFLPAVYSAVTGLLIGALAGGVVRSESGHRGLYTFAAAVFVLFGLLPYLGSSLTFLPKGIERFTDYGQAAFLLCGFFICLAARSSRGRSL